jgi:hypothetical protein
MYCYFTAWMQSLREGGNYVGEICNLAMVEVHTPLLPFSKLVNVH